MGGPAARCLDEEAVLAFVEGRLSPGRVATTEEHLAGCTLCRRLVAASARAQLGDTPDPVDPIQATLPAAEAAEAPRAPLEPGQAFGRYHILRLLGAGGMGVVYLAHDPQLDRKVALKVLRAGSHAPGPLLDSQGRLFREAQAMARLSHPNVVHVYDVGAVSGQVFIAMEYIEGGTLREWAAAAPRSWRDVLAYSLYGARGLAAAHAVGIVHRDFKPDNVLVSADGRVRVTDFGLAKPLAGAVPGGPTDPAGGALEPARLALVATAPAASALAGTPAYMSPEQLLGRPTDPKSDQFSFAVALYEALYGERPFDDASLEALTRAVLGGAVRPAPEGTAVPAAVRAALLRALAVPPEARYPSMEALALALSEAAGTGLPGPAAPAPRPRPRAPVVLAALGVAAVALVAAAVGVGRLRRHEGAAGLPARPAVTIVGFRNLAHRPERAWMSTALGELLGADLAAHGAVRVVPGERVAQMKIDLKLPDADGFGRDTLARIRDYLGCDYVVSGGFLAAGETVEIDARLQDARTGESVATASAQLPEARFAELVGRVGAALRPGLGLPAGRGAPGTSVAAAPASPEAMRWYAEGVAKLRVFDAGVARTLLERAVAADPADPLGHQALSQALAALGHEAAAAEEAQRASEAATALPALPREERLRIEGHAREITKQWDRAIESYRALFAAFPDEVEYGCRLALVCARAHRPAEALATVAALRRRGGAREDPRIDLAEAVAYSNDDYGRAASLFEQAAAKARGQGAEFVLAEARVGQAGALRKLGRSKEAIEAALEARRIYAAAGDRFRVAQVDRDVLGLLLFDGGRLSEAAERFAEAADVARAAGGQRDFGRAVYMICWVRLVQGRLGEALRLCDQSIELLQEARDAAEQALAERTWATVRLKQGELAAAQDRLERVLATFRALHLPHHEAYTLLLLGDVRFARGDRADAERSYAKAEALWSQRGEKGFVARARLERALLLVAERRADEVPALLEEPMRVFREQGMADHVLLAQAVLARARLASGDVAGARSAIAEAAAESEKSERLSSRLYVLTTRALVLAAAPGEADRKRARREIEERVAEARQAGLVADELDARLASGEIALRLGERQGGRAELARLARSARQRGFEGVAARAEAESR